MTSRTISATRSSMCSRTSSSSWVAPRIARTAIGGPPSHRRGNPSAYRRVRARSVQQHAQLVERSARAACPDLSPCSRTGPIAVRVSWVTGWPTSSSSRRTIRLRPSWITSSTIDCGLGRTWHDLERVRLHRPVLQLDAGQHPLDGRRVRPTPLDLGDVGLGQLVRRVRDLLREVAVVGEQDQPLGVGVEPSDVEEPLRAGRRPGRPGTAALRVGHRGDHPSGLVRAPGRRWR